MDLWRKQGELIAAQKLIEQLSELETLTASQQTILDDLTERVAQLQIELGNQA